MQRSSESIACLAAALAKAQAELTNPEKSSGGDDPAGWPWEGRTVVPLCPTVERVRHRAHHCDRSDRRLNLTTVLAHASGEWDCVGLAGLHHQRDRDAAPDGSGTARSYALFTLVGIPNPGGATLFRPPRYLSLAGPRFVRSTLS